MANYRAISTGVYSDLARWEVWNGSAWVAAAQLPTIADDVYANSYTVTIDVDSYASSYRNGLLGIGVNANGTFILNGGITAIGDVVNRATVNNTYCLTFASGISTVNGNVYSTDLAAGDNRTGILVTGGNLTINGSCYGQGGASVNPVLNALSVRVNGGFVVITGNSVVKNANNYISIVSYAAGATIILGRATGGSTTSARAAISCTIGECQGRNDNCVVTSKFIMPSTNQTSWVNCLAKAGANVQIEIYDELGNAVLCNPISAQGQASPADVRLGISYANGALTGTCAVPPAGAVSLGVPVGATTGTGSVTSAEIRDLILPSILSAITAP